ncbi:DUF6166 domain-containing protein [Sphingomonas sp. XXL09]|uniref:DUF6166 domain-containing protein n=1 Tax=Sphingomonas sp. XXL09 TaxID=3457787 RepID=UPI00406BB6A0
MTKRDRQSVIQANGAAGESLAEGVLGSSFAIARYNIDRDGIDLLLEPFAKDPHDLRRREVSGPNFAIVQSKYFQPGRSVALELGQAIDDDKPRPHYFVMLHTRDQDEEPVRYFLSSRDVMDLPDSSNQGFKIFSITKDDDKSQFRISVRETVRRIEAGMAKINELHYSRFTQKAWNELRRFFTYRTANKPRDIEAEYHLINVNLTKQKNVVGFAEAKAVFARSSSDPIARAIDARWDLIDTPSTWAWGYAGSGPRLLAISVLAHYFGRSLTQPTYLEAEALTLSLISNLDEGQNHIITGSAIEKALASLTIDQSEDLSASPTPSVEGGDTPASVG